MPVNKSEGITGGVRAWLKLARLYFYPLPWLVYGAGAAAAYRSFGRFDLKVFLLGFVFIFLIELFSVLANEYFDFETDSLNRMAGPFNGGSRVLVQGRLSLSSVRRAVGVLSFLAIVVGFVLIRASSTGSPPLTLTLLFIGLVFGPGYSVPPLKLSYRGLGEINVAILFSPYLILCGYGFQSGRGMDQFPWLLSLPLAFAVFAAISLAGIPDIEADGAVGKKTLAVLLGPQSVARIAGVFVFLAAGAWIFLYITGTIEGLPWLFVPVIAVHGVVLLAVMFKHHFNFQDRGSIRVVMWLAMAYLLWFGLFPLLSLLFFG